jgi:hypothetical protein
MEDTGMRVIKRLYDAVLAVFETAWNRDPTFVIAGMVFILWAWAIFCDIFIHGK